MAVGQQNHTRQSWLNALLRDATALIRCQEKTQGQRAYNSNIQTAYDKHRMHETTNAEWGEMSAHLQFILDRLTWEVLEKTDKQAVRASKYWERERGREREKAIWLPVENNTSTTTNKH